MEHQLTTGLAIGQPNGRRVIMYHPPVSSPWHLPVGISWLTALLRHDGHVVTQRYGHILGLEYVLKMHDAKGTEAVLTAIRNPTSVITELYEARMALESISKSITTADTFSVTRNNVRYAAAGYDGTIPSLLHCVELREQSVWHSYFANVEIPFAQSYEPYLYGISINDERQIVPGCIVAAMIRAACPDTLVVLGGNVWSRLHQAFRSADFERLFDFCDVIVHSEGFDPIRSLAAGSEPDHVPGVVWRNRREVIVNPMGEKVPVRFDTLPMPHYDGGARIWSPDNVIPLYTMSNCPQRCDFCSISAASETFLGVVRSIPPRRIAEWLKELASTGTRFDFFDETFRISRQLAIGKALQEIGHTATWQCYLTITDKLLDEKVCEKLYDAGCRAVQLGLETLSSASLNQISKRWNTPENYGRILRSLSEAGIQSHVFIIVGLPDESMMETLRWLPFIERYSEHMVTIKPSRYRLARGSPEEKSNGNPFIVPLADGKPLRLNREFRYPDARGRSVKKDVEACLVLIEEACRRHPAYAVTSTLPWWVNRGRYTNAELRAMSGLLPAEPADPKLPSAIKRLSGIILAETGKQVKFRTFEEVVDFFRTQSE